MRNMHHSKLQVDTRMKRRQLCLYVVAVICADKLPDSWSRLDLIVTPAAISVTRASRALLLSYNFETCCTRCAGLAHDPTAVHLPRAPRQERLRACAAIAGRRGPGQRGKLAGDVGGRVAQPAVRLQSGRLLDPTNVTAGGKYDRLYE